MSASTRFLLLVIIGVAIAILGGQLLTIVLAALLMLSYYALPLGICLVLLFVGWKLVLGEGKDSGKIEPNKTIAPTKKANPPTTIIEPHIEIERELNRLKHQIGQMNKKISHKKRRRFAPPFLASFEFSCLALGIVGQRDRHNFESRLMGHLPMLTSGQSISRHI